jgi:hypothetical protein
MFVLRELLELVALRPRKYFASGMKPTFIIILIQI